MSSIESQIKKEYEKLFHQQDWDLFKVGADYYLKTAARLNNKDIQLTELEKNISSSKKPGKRSQFAGFSVFRCNICFILRLQSNINF